MTSTRRQLLALTVASLALGCQPNGYGSLKPGPRGIVETPVADYPFGDAVPVYRAALDLLYKEGSSRPRVIVLRDSAISGYRGPCPKCPPFGPHKSRIDTSTIEGFLERPPVKPRIRKFDYPVPIAFLTYADNIEMSTAGWAYDSAHAHDHSQWRGEIKSAEIDRGYDREFLRRYPGAWGSVDLSLVGFNKARTEALLEVRESCGTDCHSSEIVFFRKTNGRWQPIERIPTEVLLLSRTRFPYLGPTGDTPAQSELLVDSLGAPLRSYSRDEAPVYRAVLDSLYDFHGQRPRAIVIAGRHVRFPGGILPQDSAIDSTTKAAFAFESAIPDPINPGFSYRIPTVIVTSDSVRALDVEGIPLQREAERKFSGEETDGFWLAFRQHYPGAWGYVEFSRIGYNPEHTQALVYAAHSCGSVCTSGDVWLLARHGDNWSVVRRTEVAEISAANFSLDSLRYLGKEADPAWYRPRRLHGIVTSFETGAILPSFVVTFHGRAFRATVKTDSVGAFQLDNLPMSESLFFNVACPVPGRADTVSGEFLRITRLGLDTTVDLAVPFRGCIHLNRNNPLIAGTKPIAAPPPDHSYSSSEIVGVYRGVLDALFPLGGRDRAGILLYPSPVYPCENCVESEAPRLIRQGLLDPSTDRNFPDRTDSTPPHPFDYRIKIDTLPLWDQYWIGESGRVQWDAMKDAYPGVSAAISFLRVGFNDRRTEALAEVYVDSAGANGKPETMLLEKQGADWRAALRHVERDATSGEWSGGKCEPTDAPAHPPSLADLGKLSGKFRLVRVGAARVFRGRTDTLRIRLGRLRPSARNPSDLVGSAELLDAKGNPSTTVAVSFERTGDVAAFRFGNRLPPGVAEFDGWGETYRILRIAGDSFFGGWDTVSGPSVPLKGYFCATRIDALAH
jgi:hypothetical protein